MIDLDVNSINETKGQIRKIPNFIVLKSYRIPSENSK